MDITVDKKRGIRSNMFWERICYIYSIFRRRSEGKNEWNPIHKYPREDKETILDRFPRQITVLILEHLEPGEIELLSMVTNVQLWHTSSPSLLVGILIMYHLWEDYDYSLSIMLRVINPMIQFEWRVQYCVDALPYLHCKQIMPTIPFYARLLTDVFNERSLDKSLINTVYLGSMYTAISRHRWWINPVSRWESSDHGPASTLQSHLQYSIMRDLGLVAETVQALVDGESDLTSIDRSSAPGLMYSMCERNGVREVRALLQIFRGYTNTNRRGVSRWYIPFNIGRAMDLSITDGSYGKVREILEYQREVKPHYRRSDTSYCEGAARRPRLDLLQLFMEFGYPPGDSKFIARGMLRENFPEDVKKKFKSIVDYFVHVPSPVVPEGEGKHRMRRKRREAKKGKTKSWSGRLRKEAEEKKIHATLEEKGRTEVDVKKESVSSQEREKDIGNRDHPPSVDMRVASGGEMGRGTAPIEGVEEGFPVKDEDVGKNESSMILLEEGEKVDVLRRSQYRYYYSFYMMRDKRYTKYHRDFYKSGL